jgi:hypothetical protein
MAASASAVSGVFTGGLDLLRGTLFSHAAKVERELRNVLKLKTGQAARGGFNPMTMLVLDASRLGLLAPSRAGLGPDAAHRGPAVGQYAAHRPAHHLHVVEPPRPQRRLHPAPGPARRPAGGADRHHGRLRVLAQPVAGIRPIPIGPGSVTPPQRLGPLPSHSESSGVPSLRPRNSFCSPGYFCAVRP